MAYVEHGMWEVLEVLKRAHEGEGKRSIARSTRRDRKTVKRYVEAAQELGWVAGLHEPDENLAGEVIRALRPGPKGDESSEAEQTLDPHKEQLEEWLKPDGIYDRGMTLKKAHELLVRNGVKASYSALYRYAVKHLGLGCQTDPAPG